MSCLPYLQSLSYEFCHLLFQIFSLLLEPTGSHRVDHHTLSLQPGIRGRTRMLFSSCVSIDEICPEFKSTFPPVLSACKLLSSVIFCAPHIRFFILGQRQRPTSLSFCVHSSLLKSSINNNNNNNIKLQHSFRIEFKGCFVRSSLVMRMNVFKQSRVLK
eukprot:TRINITY_DN6650_c0_g3_i1.p1 TRINITY_DN6650_c0_g3~~TRINITY_DN6650_c0_g3_i1.p1  ORF type:complete len:159 (-),score=13.19 TRINITY_DN6650_c0_g3_i1:70-546(-)